MKKTPIVKMADRRPEDHAPRVLIRFRGHSDGNPNADNYVDLVGAVNARLKAEGLKPLGGSNPKSRHRWVETKAHYAPQDCPVEVTVPVYSDREEILELLEMVRHRILVEEPWPCVTLEGPPDNVETLKRKRRTE